MTVRHQSIAEQIVGVYLGGVVVSFVGRRRLGVGVVSLELLGLEFAVLSLLQTTLQKMQPISHEFPSFITKVMQQAY